MATIKDVAQRAGVGVGTVSRVLNNSGPVSNATRARVMQAITELRFYPNISARQLASAQTFTIGVIVPFLTRPFFVSVLRGIEEVIANTHYNFHIYNVETVAKRDYYLHERSWRGRIDGLLVISLGISDAHVAFLQETKLPTVLVNTRHPLLASIAIDNVAGARLAVEHLIELGHRRIAYVANNADPELGFCSSRERLQGYQEVLRAHQLPQENAYIVMLPDGQDVATQATHELLDLPERPTAIFAANDELALGVIRSLQQCGLRVPDDMAVVGFDDIELAALLGLTTIRQPMTEMGRQAVNRLLSVITGQTDTAEESTLPVALVVRSTTVGHAAR